MLTSILSHPVVAIVFLLAVLVFVHEFGHYIFAKIFGVGVEIFSLGFGPVLASFKYGKTLYQIAAIPLGGYVKLSGAYRGESVPENFKGQEMCQASHWKRFIILAAGPVFNLILAVVIYAGLSYSGIEKLDSIVGSVRIGGPAHKAGLVAGDKILSINGEIVNTWEKMSKIISKSPDKRLSLGYEREGKKFNLDIVPQEFDATNYKGQKEKVGKIGIVPGYWASIITVNDKNSLAYESGLRTGDTIKGIEYSDAKGKVTFDKTDTWHVLKSTVNKLAKDRVLNFSFVILNEVSKGRDEDVLKKKSSHTRKIPMSLAKSFYQTHKGLTSNFLLSLGVLTSELTLVVDQKAQNQKGIENHDILLSFGGGKLRDIFDLDVIIRSNKTPKASVEVLRSGEIKTLLIDLKPVEQQTISGKETFYVVDAQFLGKLKPLPTRLETANSFFEAFMFGLKKTWDISLLMIDSVWGLIVGEVPLGALGGPIMIAKVAGDSVKAGLGTFFTMMALISINLAIINFIPIPVLDGGQIVIVAIEWMRRRPLSLQALENFQKIGFVMVMSLVILATYNDLSRFWTSMLKEVTGFWK